MQKTNYETQKNSIKRYLDKCERIQFYLNPDNPEDKKLMEYLTATNTGTSRQTQIKAILHKYIAMQEALKNI